MNTRKTLARFDVDDRNSDDVALEEPFQPTGQATVGILIGLDPSGEPVVDFPGNTVREGAAARSTVDVGQAPVGSEVVLLFENGETDKPIVVGVISRQGTRRRVRQRSLQVDIDGQKMILTAAREITLRCGESSLTLTRAARS